MVWKIGYVHFKSQKSINIISLIYFFLISSIPYILKIIQKIQATVKTQSPNTISHIQQKPK